MTTAERATIDFVVANGGSIPSGFTIANSRPTKSDWKPNQFDTAPNLRRYLPDQAWGKDTLKVLDVDTNSRIYVRMMDGTGEGWVLWDHVPLSNRRSAAATKQRFLKTWMGVNGLVQESQATPGARRSPPSASRTAAQRQGPPQTSATPSSAPNPYQRTLRSFARGATSNPNGSPYTAPGNVVYDGYCNEPLNLGCTHGGKSSICKGDNKGRNFHGIEAHFHSISASESVMCEDDECLVYVYREYGVCEACELNFFDHVYTEEERMWVKQSLADGLPIAHRQLCDQCVINSDIFTDSGELVNPCGCKHYRVTEDARCAASRKDEVSSGVAKLLAPGYAESMPFCANSHCGKRLTGHEKIYECGSCYGLVNKGFVLNQYDPAKFPIFSHDELFGPDAPNVWDANGNVMLDTDLSMADLVATRPRIRLSRARPQSPSKPQTTIVEKSKGRVVKISASPLYRYPAARARIPTARAEQDTVAGAESTAGGSQTNPFPVPDDVGEHQANPVRISEDDEVSLEDGTAEEEEEEEEESEEEEEEETEDEDEEMEDGDADGNENEDVMEVD